MMSDFNRSVTAVVIVAIVFSIIGAVGIYKTSKRMAAIETEQERYEEANEDCFLMHGDTKLVNDTVYCVTVEDGEEVITRMGSVKAQ